MMYIKLLDEVFWIKQSVRSSLLLILIIHVTSSSLSSSRDLLDAGKTQQNTNMK